jgi:hypothetical protein
VFSGQSQARKLAATRWRHDGTGEGHARSGEISEKDRFQVTIKGAETAESHSRFDDWPQGLAVEHSQVVPLEGGILSIGLDEVVEQFSVREECRGRASRTTV